MAFQNGEKPRRSALTTIATWVVCAFLWPALLTFDLGDWPSPNQFPYPSPPSNACGVIGAWAAYHLNYYVGWGAYPLLVFATLGAVLRVKGTGVSHLIERTLGVALFAICVSAAVHLLSTGSANSLPIGDGGLLGRALGNLLLANLDRLGTAIVLVAALVVGLVFATQGWVMQLPAFLQRVLGFTGRLAGKARTAVQAGGSVAQRAAMGATASEQTALLGRSGARRRQEPAPIEPPSVPDASAEPESIDCDDDELAECQVASDDDALKDEYEDEGGLETAAEAGQERSRPATTSPIVRFPSPDRAPTEPYPRQIENWVLPPLDLLEEPEYGFTDQQEQFVRKQALVLEQTLKEFRLDARVVEIDTGPVITMFELRLGAGIKVSQIATLSNDIARALRAHAIRVVAPISGKNTVGIEVPNSEKEKVRLHELITLAGKKASDMRLPLFLGKDAGGGPLVADLTKMPHLLIAGTTGSGKSVCLNGLIVSLLMTQRPDHVKLILIDPKMVEMSQFKSVPHLMCPIVTDLARAEKILGWAVTQMDERYELIAEARVKNIAAYNALGPEELYDRLKPENEAERARIPTRLPYVVIVIDELADLMMTAAKEVEHHLSRLAQKSRAVGVHIIVATQRPEAKVVTGLIKSNLPSRACFRVASRMDSRIVLDQNGAEVLLGQGDMLFLPPGSHKLVRAQGTFLEESEIHAVLDDLASAARPEYHPELIRLGSASAGDGSLLRDPLFDEAVEIILRSKRGSVSLLQRRLTIGYSRASRLIDQMADAGIVGEYKGSQAREVLMTVDEWRRLRADADADEGDGEPDIADLEEVGTVHG
ncbi:MAG: DNA translocase FtsK 4TM domain-containing protein [Phycisphaerae bacterium]|jgi:S-DNA-T family DNA segregation ATPase FtsK/SpoIIIE